MIYNWDFFGASSTKHVVIDINNLVKNLLTQ